MQKKIIALAVAGLVSGAALAQSNVSIYGRMDIGYLNGDASATTAAGVKTSADVSSTGFNSALTPSRIGFKGSEDLGNGLKANFNLEYALGSTARFGADTGNDGAAGTQFTTRLATVGVSSANWGAIDLGRQFQAIEMAWGPGSTGMQNGAVGQLYGDTRLTDPRADELITYTSPMMSGFQVKAQYGKGRTETDGVAATAFGENSHKRVGLAGSFTTGPMNVNLGYSKESTEAAGATALLNTDMDLSQWVASGSYNFGVAKAFGIYTRGKSEGGYTNTNLGIVSGNGEINSRKGWELGVHVPVGPATLLASVYRAKTDFAVATATTTDADHKGYQLGALYPLSKRTMVYGLYGSTDTDHTATVRKYSNDQFAVGLRHDF